MKRNGLITRVGDLPSWFDRARYEIARNLGQFYWYIELSARAALKSVWEREGTLATGRYPTLLPDYWEMIQHQGFISLPSAADELVDPEEEKAIAETFYKDKCQLKSIATLSRLNAYGFFWFASDQEKFIKNTSIFFAHEEEIEALDDKAFIKISQWLHGRASHARLEGAFIQVKLEASDEQIKKDFNAWLAYERAYQKRLIPKKNFTASDFANWCAGGILPYLDLTLWASMEGTKISDYVMAQALFKEAYAKGSDVDPEGKLKTTKKKANYLLMHEVLQVLCHTPEAEESF